MRDCCPVRPLHGSFPGRHPSLISSLRWQLLSVPLTCPPLGWERNVPIIALVDPLRTEHLSLTAATNPSSLTFTVSTWDGLASLGWSHLPPSTLPPASTLGPPLGHLPVPTLGFSEPHAGPRLLASHPASLTPASSCSSQHVSPLLHVLQLHTYSASLSRVEGPVSIPLRKPRSLQWPAVVSTAQVVSPLLCDTALCFPCRREAPRPNHICGSVWLPKRLPSSCISGSSSW